MYRGLVASGAILGIFGVFLILTDFYIPLGVSIFGLPIAVLGTIMLALGFIRHEPLPVEPEPGKKFCWYCMAQIPKDLKECHNCGLHQHDAQD